MFITPRLIMDRLLIMDMITYSADNNNDDGSSWNLEEKQTSRRGLGCGIFLTKFGDCSTSSERNECIAKMQHLIETTKG